MVNCLIFELLSNTVCSMKLLWKVVSVILLYCVNTLETTVLIYGLMPVNCKVQNYVGSVPVFHPGDQIKLNIFGNNLHQDFDLGISLNEMCQFVEPSKVTIEPRSGGHLAVISLTAPLIEAFYWQNVRFSLCVKETNDVNWIPQNQDSVALYIEKPFLTPVLAICIIIFCFCTSSLMSGLNIGLMALSPKELLILTNAGTIKEQKYAKKILPVRQSGNYLLCSILLTATLCNSIATVNIDNFVSDAVAVAITTIIIVILCEILPQAICTYFPLLIGYYTIYITRLCMIVTSPVSYPLGKLLNFLLGNQIAASYTRERLKELIKLTELPAHEEKIISGTLDMSKKKVEDIMTMLDDVFTLPITAIMDFETIALILASGYSRIPIYVDNKSNICFVLLTKDLALLDPDDKVPINLLVDKSKFMCSYIPVGTTIDNVLGLFKRSREHMAFVVKEAVKEEDVEKLVIGIVTFEDVIEEILQAEINDETDTFADNRSKKKISAMDNQNLLSLLKKCTRSTAPSENLKLAAFHFLSGVDLLSIKYISSKVLLNLLSLDVYYTAPGKGLPQDVIYIPQVQVDFFVMVLEGLMEVKVGFEELKFEAGPFRYFGLEALKSSTGGKLPGASNNIFRPDYYLLAVKKTLYLKITRSMYEAAILATRFERFQELPRDDLPIDILQYFGVLANVETETIS